jgi:hypothetical protein
MLRKLALPAVSAVAILSACSSDDRPPLTSVAGNPGAVSMRIAFDPASPFKSIARSGDVTVSAADMASITVPLQIGDSAVDASIKGIPTGKGRSIRMQVYDSAGAARYKGSAVADIYADSTTSVSLTLARITGSAIVTGSVSETDSTADSAKTPWGASVSLSVGAQGAVLGAVVELDSGKTWTAAVANANQAAIDLVFLYYAGAFHLDNPVSAKAAGVANNINLTNSYDDARIRNLRLVKITVSPITQEDAEKAFAAGSKIYGSAVTAGDMLLVESTGGRLFFVTVAGISGMDRAGTAELKIASVTLP